MKSLIVFVFLVMSSTIAAKTPFPQHIHCFDKVTQFLDKLGTVEKWKAFPQGVGGEIPGFGAVELHQSFDASTLFARSPKTQAVVSWTRKECHEKALSFKKVENGFTDLDFADVLEKNEKGFVYIWSPHMELSVSELENLSKEKPSYPMTVVLDPEADLKLAEKIAMIKKWPKEYLKLLDSKSLKDFDITIHYPSIVLYQKGKLLLRIPGYSGKNLSSLLQKKFK